MRETQPKNLLVGMKEICRYLGVSEATALKWHRELSLPIKKTAKSGYWVGSRVKIDEWSNDVVTS